MEVANINNLDDQKLSVSGNSNSNNTFSNSDVTRLATDLGINQVTARILFQRNVRTVDQAKAFLTPTLRNHLPNPRELKNVIPAVERIITAIKNNEYITIFSDFDVDGITSASQIWLVLSNAKAKLRYYVPDRQKEGYGLSEYAVKKLAEEKTNLLVKKLLKDAKKEMIDHIVSLAKNNYKIQASKSTSHMLSHFPQSDLVAYGNTQLEAGSSENDEDAAVVIEDSKNSVFFHPPAKKKPIDKKKAPKNSSDHKKNKTKPPVLTINTNNASKDKEN
jgi:hypothetical protein